MIYPKQTSDVVNRIITGSFWTLSGSVFSKIFVFLATLCVARILIKENYGELSIIRSTMQMFVSISAFGIGTTATKYIAQYKSTDKTKLAKIYVVANLFAVTIATIASFAIFIFAQTIATKSLHAPHLVDDIRIAAGILFFSLLNGAQTGTLAGFEDFKRIAKSNVITGFIELILLTGLAYFYGLKGAICGFGLTYLVAWLYNAFFINRHIKALEISLLTVIRQIKLKDFKIIYQFSLPIALSSWINMPAYWWAKTYLIENNGFAAMATYDVADQWRAQVLFLPSIIGQVIMPILSNTVANGEKKNTQKAIKTNFALNGSIAFGISLIMLLAAPYIIKLYGKSYINYAPIILLCFAGAIDSISNICNAIIISHNKVWSILTFNIVWASCIVLLTMLFINKGYEENGLATAYLISNVILTFLMMTKSFYVLKHHNE